MAERTVNRALVTGVTGFLGRHLAAHLLARGCEVAGFGRGNGESLTRLTNVTMYTADIREPREVARILAHVQPDAVYHLAGNVKSPIPEDFYETNLLGTINLFEALVATNIRPAVVLSSSSAVYGRGAGGRPITEKFAVRPLTHYGISKASQELVAYRYQLSHRMPILIARTFNVIGPGQSPLFSCSAFARQIAVAEVSSMKSNIMTGQLSAQRDMVDVRDVARAYEIIARRGQLGAVYNVCSERPVSIADCLRQLLSMSNVSLDVELDTSRLQRDDVPIQTGCSARLRRATDWRPEMSLTTSLRDVLEFWRHEVRSASA